MEKLKKYKKQIVTFITISLLLTYGIYPCLTMANTFANIIGAIALLILILWGILEVKDVYEKEDEDEKRFREQWDAHVAKQTEAMKEMHKQNDALKKKSNPKQFDGVKSDEPFVKTRKKTNKTK
jgi:riboflavin synthase